MKFIDLGRRFRDLTNKEKDDPSLLALLGEEYFDGSTWDQLLESRRVVLLAEGGSGKSREMQNAALGLVLKGEAAFFLPIEALADEDMASLLPENPGDLERFESWKVSNQATAWFFLDAVDELKLTQGKLDRALAKVAAGLGPAIVRARFAVSCRPTDWRPVEDRDILERRLPALPPPEPQREIEDDEFLSAFRRERRRKAKDDSPPKLDVVRTVALLPLNDRQIRKFAEERGVTNPGALLGEISKHEAWAFARRPLDLDNMIAVWKDQGRLGTRLEQHQADVANGLRDDPDRADANVLSLTTAREGVERLALAMSMMAIRAIRSPEQAIAQDREAQALDALQVLDDWTPAQVAALLRRPIFDPATYGRVSFHQRTVQEFLAAERLRALRERGMANKQIHRLLFSDLYGEPVVIPSMAPIAAWLAQTDSYVLAEILSREPEILLLNGDPEALPLDARINLLRSYVNAYGDGGWRGLHMPIVEVRRLALPDMADEIRSCWEASRGNSETDRLLLQLIWLGPIPACADIVRSAAFDSTRNDFQRIISIRALGAMNFRTETRAIADSILNDPDAWATPVIQTAINDLFPQVMTASELGTLLLRLPEPGNPTGGFGRSIHTLAESIPAESREAIELRDLLTRLVWEWRDKKLDWHQPHSRFSYLTPALFRLCARQLKLPADPSQALLHACVLAERFHGRESLDGDARAEMKDIIEASASNIRRLAFLEDLRLAEALDLEVQDYKRTIRLHQWGFVSLAPKDWPWLVELAGDPAGADPQIVAECLVQLYVDRDRNPADLAELELAFAGSPIAAKFLADFLRPREVSEEWTEHEAHMARMRAERADADAEGLATWAAWRDQLLADVPDAFGPKRLRATLGALVNWLHFRGDDRNTIAASNWPDVRRVLGDAVGDAFEDALSAFWRREDPPVPWRRFGEEKAAVTLGMMLGLSGLQVDTQRNSKWASTASDADARRAAGWATIENSSPEWLPALVASHPEAVTAVLEEGIEAELDAMEHHPRALNLVQYGDPALRQRLAPFLKRRILAWPEAGAIDEFQQHANVQNLERALSVVTRVTPNDRDIAAHAARAFLASPTAPLALQWILAVAATDIGSLAKHITDAITTHQVERNIAKAWLATTFSRSHGSSIPVRVDAEAGVLLELVRLGYALVRRGEGVTQARGANVTADDDAQMARDYLLSALIAKPGQAAHDALVALANDDALAHLKDRLLLHARERSAEDSVAPPLTASQFRNMDHDMEAPPRNAHELFQVMLDRLDDVNFDLHHHDMNERHAWRQLEREKELQPLLARKLMDASRNAFRESREEEVVDGRFTDIRLAATAFEGRVVIEMKVGDNCTLTQLEDAIVDQLIGKYLRHPQCSGGCLLVTYAGRKGFLGHDSTPISFGDVIALLRAKAAEVTAKEQGRIRLAVIGFDLR